MFRCLNAFGGMTSVFVPIYIFDFNLSFPIPQSAAQTITKHWYGYMYDGTAVPGGQIPCPYPTSFPSKTLIYVKWAETMQVSKVYSSQSESAVIANNIFEYVQTFVSYLGIPYFGIPISQQFFFAYRTNTYQLTGMDASKTYKENGYYNNSSYNYLSVKNSSSQEPVTPDLPLQYYLTVFPAFLVNPNLSISTFTYTTEVDVGQTLLQPGSYTMTIPDLGNYTLTTTLLSLSNTLTFIASPGQEAVFPNQNIVYDVVVTTSTPNIFIYLTNQISVTIPTTVVAPVIVAAPGITESYTLTYESGGVTTFPVGNYIVTFTSQLSGPGTEPQVLPVNFVVEVAGQTSIIINNVTLTDESTYILEGYWENGLNPPDNREAYFVISNNIQVNCFLKGTRILCLDIEENKEKYVNIEHIREGDLVRTLNDGYVPVKYNVSKKILNNPYKLGKDKLFILSKSNYPQLERDLVVTGGHSILVDSLTLQEATDTLQYWTECEKSDGKFKLLTVCNNNATPYPIYGMCEIYDIVLESDDPTKAYGIYAEGILTDSMPEQFFKTFSNMKIVFDEI